MFQFHWQLGWANLPDPGMLTRHTGRWPAHFPFLIYSSTVDIHDIPWAGTWIYSLKKSIQKYIYADVK